MSYLAIEAAFVAAALEQTSLTYSADPDTMASLPTFILAPMLPLQEDVETGPRMQVTYRWQVWVYADGNKDRDKVAAVLAHVDELMSVPRQDQRLGDTCDFHQLVPRDEAIEIVPIGEKFAAVGRLELHAELDQP